MAIEGSVCIELIKATQNRGLVWLIIKPPNKYITAKEIFDNLPENQKADLRNRFDYWLSGGIHNKYFHGWGEPEYKNCFVFKLQALRVFGFLCHPYKERSQFQMCVLCSYSIKDMWEADKAEKNRMNDLKNDEKVIKALKNIKENCSEAEKEKNGLDRKKH